MKNKKIIDEAELEAKAEASYYEAEEWWERLEPEQKIEIYLKEDDK